MRSWRDCNSKTRPDEVLMGQWTGRFEGSNVGDLIIDLDYEGDHYEGHAYLFNDDPSIPGAIARLYVEPVAGQFRVTIDRLGVLDPKQPRILQPSEISAAYADFLYPNSANASIVRDDSTMIVEWRTSIETFGRSRLERSIADTPSDLIADARVRCWSDFKAHVSGCRPYKMMFRGQPQPWRLQTSFHRTRRKDLVKFMERDIPALHRLLTAQTRHLFNLSNPAENGAFWNLAQHHGFPTPLLDWTSSPFVGVFFAYRHRQETPRDTSSTVRVFAFDREEWEKQYPQLQSVAFCRPHFSILEALAIENNRAVPQQALASVTNIDDIETYIRKRELESGKTFLTCFDLPYAERFEIMRELSLMGITAGSLLPGLDGTCEALRGRFFHPFGDSVAVPRDIILTPPMSA